MTNNKSAVLFVILITFLFLLTAPIIMVFGHYSGLLQLPEFVTYHNVSIAATAGLFIIPVLFIYLAAIIIALKRRRHSGVSSVAVANVAVAKKRALVPVRYAWETVFGPEKEPVTVKLKPIPKSSAALNSRAMAGVVIALAVIGLIILVSVTPSLSNAFGRSHNETKSANITITQAPGAANADNFSKNVSGKMPASAGNASKENVLSRFFSAVTRLQPQQKQLATPLVKVEKPAPQIKISLSPIKNFAGKIKSWAVSSIGSLKSRVSKVSHVVWRNIAIAAVVILFAVSVFYSHKTGQLGEIPEWLNGWRDWLAGILYAAWRNIWKVIGGVIVVAVIGGIIAAAVFRKWLSAHGINVKLPTISSMPSSPFDALIAVRDFVSVYRLYIIIGVFAFLAMVGILFAFEKKGKK